ncbi:Meiotically up-regulated protein [Spathaspora sp. JA1]|nr:Meiotically up-regulated protein [Spathaspora sp. JA1]
MSVKSRSNSPRPFQEDTLARESDVTVSTNVTQNAEYKGFAIYVITTISLLVWISWTILPETILHKLSIYYYPDRYWALAIPTYSLMLMAFIYWVLALYNTEVLTLPLNDIRTIVDEHSHFPGQELEGKLTRDQLRQKACEYVHDAPSGVWDLPISLVNEVLYNDSEEGDI